MNLKQSIAAVVAATMVAGCAPPPALIKDVDQKMTAHYQVTRTKVLEDKSLCRPVIMDMDSQPVSQRPGYNSQRTWTYTVPNQRFYVERALWDVCHEVDPATRMASRQKANDAMKNLVADVLVGAVVGVAVGAVLANNAPSPRHHGPRPPRPPR